MFETLLELTTGVSSERSNSMSRTLVLTNVQRDDNGTLPENQLSE